MLDEDEFLSPYGIRALSRYHAEHPYVFPGQRAGVSGKLSAGGIRQRNVRWQLELARTIWMPVNALLIRALMQYYGYYGDNFQIECPTGSGNGEEPVRGRPRVCQPAHKHFPT